MKNKWKKWLGICLWLGITAAALTGCGKETQPAQEYMTTEEKTTETETEVSENLMRIGALKGPTTLGILNLQEKAQRGETQTAYEFEMMTAADELMPLLIKGELDVALLPANVAAILYQKTNAGISVIDINTLGVLYMVSADASITSVSDLEGKTIYVTGKGTTPDYALQYVLEKNGLSAENCDISYKSEATEIVALLQEDAAAVGLLPQPFVTVACAQNANLSIVLDMNEEWEKAAEDKGKMVTGVTVVRNAFLEEHGELVEAFLQEHAESTQALHEDVEAAAILAVKSGIIAKEQIAQKAIPACNITCITGEEMKEWLSGYLQVLYGQNPASVGGALPEDNFYYMKN